MAAFRRIVVFLEIFGVLHSFIYAATDFCSEPLGMKRSIIQNSQITASSVKNSDAAYQGYQARLDNANSWCSSAGSQQWLKVDFGHPLSVTGITIQGDPVDSQNYIKKFKIHYIVDEANFVYESDGNGDDKVFDGANGPNQQKDILFPAKPIPATIFEFRPTSLNAFPNACLRLELYGCSYVCEKGLGIESGSALPSGFIMTSSSHQASKDTTAGRLKGSSAWCASSSQNQYLQIDFGQVITISGIATQGDPTSNSWVTSFRLDYGTTTSSFASYQEDHSYKNFIGNDDQNTLVVHWFRTTLTARYVKIKPSGYSGGICMRIEIMGCSSDSVYEFGTENRALENSSFAAFAYSIFFPGTDFYKPYYGRLNSYRPWGRTGSDTSFMWFKVDLGRTMLVSAIATQGDGTYGPNYFPDYKLQYSLDAANNGGSKITVKEETNSNEKIFVGNTNNAGVKFNFLEHPISTRYVQWIKKSNVKHDYTLRVEIYGKPQVCSTSFGMYAGEELTYNPLVTVSSGYLPSKKSKINTRNAWCAGNLDTNQYFQYDFGTAKVINGFAIQGDPLYQKVVKTFKVQHGLQESSLVNYQEGGSDKVFVGGKDRDFIVYHWFSQSLKIRYLRIVPLTWQSHICLRLNAYGCPKSGCYDTIGVQSTSKVPDASISSSSFASGNEAHKGRFNLESVWEACQFGSCSVRESAGSKPWIQVCLASIQTISAVIIQGHGNKDSMSRVTEFSLKYRLSVSGKAYDFKNSNVLQKFAGPKGRYASSQVDLPVPVIARCIMLQVESQSPSNQNVGLRWELLGCSTVAQVTSASISPSSASVAKNGDVTLTCTVNAQPGVAVSWKNGSTILSTAGIHEVGNDVIANGNVNDPTTKTLKVTANGLTVAASFQTCTLKDSQGNVECKQSYECLAAYPGISSSKSATVEVTVTGFLAKPSKPSGVATSITNTSVAITWNAADPADFLVGYYKSILKKKSDNSVVETKEELTTTSASFDGLNVFTDYIVEISARSLRFNVYSETETHEFKTDEGVSSPPTTLSATAASSTSVNISWNEPSQLNGVLHDYRIRYKISSESSYSPLVNAAKQTRKTVSLLKPFTDYEFEITATTKGGTIFGQWTSAVGAKTQEGRPTAPQNLREMKVLTTSALVNWAKPTEENGIIQDYTVMYDGVKRYNATFQHSNTIYVGKDPSLLQTVVNLTNLVPGTNYSVVVAATTGGGQGDFSSKILIRTLYTDPPKPPLQNQGKFNGATRILLSNAWDINGPISEYQLSFLEGHSKQCSASSQPEKINPSKIPLALEFVPGVKSVVGIASQFKTIANYTVCYRAVIKSESQTHLGEIAFTTIELKSLEKLDPKKYESEIKDTGFVVPLTKGPENVKSYHIIVVEGNITTVSKRPEEWNPSELGPYDTASYSSGKPYVTAVLLSYVDKFQVGDGKEYMSSARRRRNVVGSKYVNVPLKPATEYLVFQRAYVTQGQYYSSPWIGPFKTKSNKIEPSVPTPEPPYWISGVIVPLLIIFIVIGILLLYRRRNAGELKNSDNSLPKKTNLPLSDMQGQQDNQSFEQDEDEATNVESTCPVEPKHHGFIHRKHSSAASLKHRKVPLAVGHDKHHPAVSVEEFARHIKDLQRDSHHGITSEFEDLNKGQLHSWDIAVNPVNKPKNRYANIAAYDHSRVHLNPIPDVQHSDYFNANYIRGYSGDPVYIASQGPIESVLGDFWRMLWDTNVAAIVMVTNLVERGKKKCAQYWPDMGSTHYGDLTVTMVSIHNYVDYAIRCLSVSRKGTDEVRILYQYHYLTWPDFGIPEFPTDLLNMRAKFRRQFPYKSESPVLVHCSAGVGRTGTFIVIDTMLDLLQTQRKIDVFNYLNFIRSQRIHLVQVEEQYIFVYNALLEAVTCGKTEIETQNLRIQINQLQNNDKSGKTGFEQQFQRLLLVTRQFTENETSDGRREVNKKKNRKQDVLPRDGNRVLLQQSIYENDGGTDYINATFVNGYKKKNAYIATQHPLAETIDDFWSMIFQGKVATIVLLNRLNDGREKLPKFWPDLEDSANYGKVTVHNQYESEESGIIERNLSVSHVDANGEYSDLTMFHFQGWPDHNVPRDSKILLSLMSKVEKCQQQQDDYQPIVVICRNGAGRTGTFLAISIILERFKTEQLVDVFQTIKKLRAFRPQFVENITQYKFCYHITQAYMDSFDTYANFSG